MKKPSAEFFRTLGHYLYAYKKDDDWIYIGKGKDDRCMHHLKDKGYYIEDCIIMARNLENLNNEKQSVNDIIAHSLETQSITFYKPRDNKQSGHKRECFIMTDLSKLFVDYKNSQRNMSIELSELILENSETLENIGFTESRKSAYKVESEARDSLVFGFVVSSKSSDINCYLKASTDKAYDKLVESVKEILVEYDWKTERSNQVDWNVDNLEEALNTWKTFS